MGPESQRRTVTGLDGRLTDRESQRRGDGRHWLQQKHRKKKKSLMFISSSRCSLWTANHTLSVSQYELSYLSSVVWNMKSGSVWVYEQQIAVGVSGETDVAARHSSQLWLEMMCVFWPEERKGSCLVSRHQPDGRWQLPFSRLPKAKETTHLGLLRHGTCPCLTLPRPGFSSPFLPSLQSWAGGSRSR